MRKWIGALITALVFGVGLSVASGQGSLSDQVLRLLDRANVWTKTQTMAANYGWQFNDGAPTTTTNRLYNIGGTLYWSGLPVGIGVGTNYWSRSGTTLATTTVGDKVRIGSAGTTTYNLYVDGTQRNTGAALFDSTVGTGALTAASLGVTAGATVGTTLQVTGVTTASTGVILGTNTGTTAGTIRWNGANFQGYSGAGWVDLDAAAGASGGWTENAGTNTVHLTTGTRKVSIGAGTTAPAFLGILGTTEQLRLAYDATNYLSTTVSATGTVAWDAISATAADAFTIADPVTINDNLDIVKTTAQLRTMYDGSNYATFTVGAAGILTLNMTGASQALVVSDPTSIAGLLTVTATTQQLQVAYDGANYLALTIGATGIGTFNMVGAGSAFTFSDPITVNANLEVVKAGEQFRATNVAGEYMTLTVSAAGVAVFDAVSAGVTDAFTFQDPVTFNGNIEVVSTTAAQIKATYDAGNYATLTVGATGIVALNAVSGTAADAFTIADPVTINSNLEVVKTTQQFKASYDATHYMTLTVGNDAKATFATVHAAGVGEFAFQNPTTFGSAAVGEIRLLEPSGTGTDYTGFKAPASVTTTVVYALPAADGSVGDQLTTDGSGALSWAAAGAGSMANPMTTTGDLIYAADTAAPSTPARRGIGTTGQCLVVAGGLPTWGACTGTAAAAGADTQVQYNNAGSFGANAAFTWVAPTLSLSGSTTGKRLNLQVRNTGTGSTDTSYIQLGNNTQADALSLWVNSAAYTAAGNYGYLWNKVTGGNLSLGANNAQVALLSSTGVNVTGGVTGSGLLTINGFGAHTFSSGGTGMNAIAVTNTTSGTGNYAQIGVDAGTTASFMRAYSQAYTTSTWQVQAGMALYTGGPGGISIAAEHASGAIRFYSGGSTLRGTVTAAGLLDWVGAANIGTTLSVQTTAWILGSAPADTVPGNGSRGTTKYFAGLPAVGRGTFLQTLPMPGYSDVYPGSVANVDNFATLRTHPVKRGNKSSQSNLDWYEGYTHFMIDSPGVTGALLDGYNRETEHSGWYQNSFLVPDFWYDGATRRLRIRSLIMTDVGDPVDLSIVRVPGYYPNQQVITGNTQYATIGNIGFRTWLINNGPSAYFASIQGIGGGIAGKATGLLVLATTPGASGAQRPIGSNEDPELPAGGWGGSSYDATDLVPHVALHPSGQFEIGFQTDPTTVQNVNYPLLLVRGMIMSRADVGDNYMYHLRAEGNASTRKGMRIQYGTNNNSGTNYAIRFDDGDGDEVGEISSSGGVTSYTTSSDRRLKEHIVPTTMGLDVLSKIQIRDFNFIADVSKTRRQGLIAQELYPIYPLAVTVGNDKEKSPWGVDSSKLVPLLIQSVQDLSAQVKTLEARIMTLEQR